MQERILASLGITDAKVFVRDVDRPNIATLRWQCRTDRRANEIAALLSLAELQGQKTMIFVPSAKVGNELRTALSALGMDIPFYHSRLGDAWERQELVKRFLGQSRPVVDQIICTNAFGMGLDVPNVRLVIHWQQSASAEDLLQEFGRAGRDGKPSASVIFHDGRGSSDVGRLKFMAEKTVEAAPLDAEQKLAMLAQRNRQIEQVSTMLQSRSCFRESVRTYFGDRATRPKRSLPERILDWVFGTPASTARHGACCDHCDADFIGKHGALPYVAQIVGGGFKKIGKKS